MLKRLQALLFPPKCLFCQKLLPKEQTDLCHECRNTAPEFEKSKIRFSFVARWTGVWYYKDGVRDSILRYKFQNKRSYAKPFGSFLAMKLLRSGMDHYDILTWIPISRRRKFKRGFDQVEELAKEVALQLEVPATATLRKIRHIPPQSGMGDAAHRRANVLDAYRVLEPELIKGKRILLLDDIVTTGATASECAKTLMIAGAKEVNLAVLAVAVHEK